MKNRKQIETYLDYLYKKDYKERPVPVREFLSSPLFFGSLTDYGKGVYPIWMEKMEEFLAEDSKYLGVLTGAIGVGKTRVAVYMAGYVMYRILCLRNAWSYFGLTAGGKMSIAFFNMTKSLGETRAFNILQQHLLSSDWFLKRGIITGKELNRKLEFPLFDYALSSPYCFTGDTKISLLDGREIEISKVEEELKKKELFVYSYNVEKKMLVPGKVVGAGKTGTRTRILRVVLDNNEIIRCTPNHRFMMRDGTYKEAQLLQPEVALMPNCQIDPKVICVEEGGYEDVYDIEVEEYHNFALSAGVFVHNSAGFNTQGRDVIIAIMDEVDSPTASEKQKQRVLSAYESTVRRFESRFVDDTYNETIGKFLLVASKQEQDSFLDAFIIERKNSKNTYIADIKYWEIKHKDTYSGKVFTVMLGDVYLPSKILETQKERERAIAEGYRLLDVPVEFREAFDRDIVGALRDIAGVAAVGLRKSKLFPSEKSIINCYDDTKQDPVNLTTIPIGLNDDIELIKFFDLSKIRVPHHIPRFIHCDIAYSGDGDALSIAMSCVKDWVTKDVEQADGTFEIQKVPVVETDFVVRLKGKPGDEVPIYRVRKLILDLRAAGFKIHFSADLALLSADTKQILSRSGIECSYLSLDKDVKPYLSFRELVHEERWICHRCPILHFELANLEYDKDRQKIDHPHKVQILEFIESGGARELVVLGSKDCSDAVAGSVFKAFESAPSVPLETSTIKTITKAMQKQAVDNTYDWVLNKQTSQKNQPENYVLQHTKTGLYWIWSREHEGVPPSLKGPFKERLLNLPVIETENPATFSPQVRISGDVGLKAKVNLLKLAGGH